MKLTTFRDGTVEGVGVVEGATVMPVSALVPSLSPATDIGPLLVAHPTAIDQLRDRLADPDRPQGLSIDAVQMLGPVRVPPTIRDFATFEQHYINARRQHTNSVPEEWYRLPTFYFTNPLRLVPPGQPVPFPSSSSRWDYECEVAIVIGRRVEGTDEMPEDWVDCVAGFTLFNDWSARDLIVDEMPIGLGPAKGKDFASSLGPWLVTTDELAPQLHDGRLHVTVEAYINDRQVTNAALADMHYSFPQIIEYAARDSVLVPGDVIGTGTVGFGCVFERPEELDWLKSGDVVELRCEQLGSLVNTVA